MKRFSMLLLFVCAVGICSAQQKGKVKAISPDPAPPVPAVIAGPPTVVSAATGEAPKLFFTDFELDVFIGAYTEAEAKQLARDKAQLELDEELGHIKKMWEEQLRKSGLPPNTGFRVDVARHQVTPMIQIPTPPADLKK